MRIKQIDKSVYSEARKYVWDYFQLHSSQRIATFNFYITLSTAILTGIGTILGLSRDMLPIAAVLGFILTMFSFIFWKLDVRNKGLIKNAEGALKYLEETFDFNTTPSELPIVSLFARDDEIVRERRGKKSVWFWRNHYSYSNCFNLIFATFGVLGFLSTIFALLKTVL